jgi:sortase A
MPDNFSPNDDRSAAPNNAADLIRQKLAKVYADEPGARAELEEAQAASGQRSRHQQFMFELGNSGRSLAEIQTAWHNYYVNLPDVEKHRVWQEFYEEHNRRSATQTQPNAAAHPAASRQTDIKSPPQYHRRRTTNDPRSVADIKHQLINRVGTRSRVKRGGHLKSLMFGLSSGAIVVVILLFSFFNERFIAPFITPSKNVSNTSIIIDPTTTAVGPEPKIIIPKINVEIPIIFDEPSIDERAVQNALERGVLHYATTSNPGETGNGAIFGHSSNNILNKGKYKFAFVLLKRLENGDTFIVQKDGKRYVYRVFDKKTVKPEAVNILSETGGKGSTFSLITCDPPGTTLNRLVVTGEQISPDPVSNVASTAKPADKLPEILPSNSESLWHRLTSWLSS